MPSEKKVVVKPVEATKDMEKALSPPPSPPADGSPGAWGDGCCNCFSDCCICCANCWCPCFTVAQVYVRAMNKPQQFGVICALLWVLYIAYQVIGQWYNAALQAELNRFFTEMAYGSTPMLDQSSYAGPQAIYGLVGAALFFTQCMLVCQARTKIKQRDNIPEDNCTTCCMSCCCCCEPCGVCQLLRHEGLNGSNYSLCDPMGGQVETEPKMTGVAQAIPVGEPPI